jgi:hypothetical protein
VTHTLPAPVKSAPLAEALASFVTCEHTGTVEVPPPPLGTPADVTGVLVCLDCGLVLGWVA